MKARERILDMLEAGKISADDAARLLEAITSATSQADCDFRIDPRMSERFREMERRMRKMHCRFRPPLPPRPPRPPRCDHKGFKFQGKFTDGEDCEVNFGFGD